MSEKNSYHLQLRSLAQNLWWTWHPEAVSIFRDLDPKLWREVNHNPLEFLDKIDAERVSRKADDLALESRIADVTRRLEAYCQSEDAWALTRASKLRVWPVAYFSAEFGVHESLPTYAGGLGILAGDHLKSASDLGVPIVGVGLLYAEGYFHQQIDESGWQQEVYTPLNMDTLPLAPVMNGKNDGRLTVDIPIDNRTVKLQVWLAMVGRIPLYLLDSNVPDNSDEDRHLTGRLYDAAPVTRIRQELILGVGGIRVLAALNKMPGVVHINEGHSAFALLEWIRLHMTWEGVDFDNARDHVGRRAIFTTHTPVAAGHDRFAPELIRENLGFLHQGLGIDEASFLGLGRVRPKDAQEPFCMTVLALKVAHRANGVSALHGRVSRNMWRPLWNMRSEQEVPIGHITNGVHVRGWMAPLMHQVYDRHLGRGWLSQFGASLTREKVNAIPDEEIWDAHQELKRSMLQYVRRRLKNQRRRWGVAEEKLTHLDAFLKPEILTIGFARRFAEYKRAVLLFHDIDRLVRMLNHPDRPVQLIFAGKAHPANEQGKKSIQKIFEYAKDDRLRSRMAFVEDYDIGVGRHLVQGVDLWLNNPIKPMEACGTSGQKVVMNGGINLSVLDGWWAEAFDGHNGFAIGYGGNHPDPAEQFRRDADLLYTALEDKVIPLFYERDAQGMPRQWMKMVKWGIVSLGWRFSADRMVRDYFQESYLPAAGVGPSDDRDYRARREVQ